MNFKKDRWLYIKLIFKILKSHNLIGPKLGHMTSPVTCCRGGTNFKFGRCSDTSRQKFCKNRFTAKKIQNIQDIHYRKNSFENFARMEQVPGNQEEYFENIRNIEDGGNTKTPSSMRKCVFTLNNYTEEEYNKLLTFAKKQKCFIIGKEIGAEGTPHLQGYMVLKNATPFKNLKSLSPRAHWELAKGTEQENRTYCSKENNYVTNIPLPRNERLLLKYNNIVWKPWQQNIIDLCNIDPDPRTINWFVDYDGNTGKSFLSKYLCLKYDAIICNGKTTDVFNQVCAWLQSHGEDKDPKVVIMDCPRASQDYINYQAIEKLKDGCFYSGKYEGGMCLFEPPHVLCFANCSPDRNKMSLDRWNVVDINE